VREFPRDARGLEAIYARFESTLEELLLQTARRRPAPWREALHAVCDRLSPGWWFLAGSAGLAVRGFAVHPRDLDLVVEDAQRVAAALEDTLVHPLVQSDCWIAEWFGRAFLHARVEWIAGVRPTDEPAEYAAARVDIVRWEGRELRVPPLELQRAVAERRGLTDRLHLANLRSG
jgi:hypothetical protein